jgi:hypothetical protein
MTTDERYDFLLEFVVKNEETLLVATKINGYSDETLDEVCYVLTGLTCEQYSDEIK